MCTFAGVCCTICPKPLFSSFSRSGIQALSALLVGAWLLVCVGAVAAHESRLETPTLAIDQSTTWTIIQDVEEGTSVYDPPQATGDINATTITPITSQTTNGPGEGVEYTITGLEQGTTIFSVAWKHTFPDGSTTSSTNFVTINVVEGPSILFFTPLNSTSIPVQNSIPVLDINQSSIIEVQTKVRFPGPTQFLTDLVFETNETLYPFLDLQHSGTGEYTVTGEVELAPGSGPKIITVRTDDNFGLSDSQSFEVNPVQNTAPRLSRIFYTHTDVSGEQSAITTPFANRLLVRNAREPVPLFLRGEIVDDEGNLGLGQILFNGPIPDGSAAPDPVGVSQDRDTGAYTFKLFYTMAAGSGEKELEISGQDQTGGGFAERFLFSVVQDASPTDLNFVPSNNFFKVVPDVSQSSDIEVEGSFRDIGANVAFLSVNGRNADFELTDPEDGLYRFGPILHRVTDVSGQTDITVRTVDQFGFSAQKTHTITIAQNRPPFGLNFEPINDASFTVSGGAQPFPIEVSGTVFDPDQNLHGVSVNSVPVSFDLEHSASGRYTFRLVHRVSPISGPTDITVRAEDEFGLSLLETHTVILARDSSVLPGDFDGDQLVGLGDFFIFVDAFGKAATGENQIFDLDGNGQIDFSDFFIFVDFFGQRAGGKPLAKGEPIDSKAAVALEVSNSGENQRLTVQVKAAGMDGLSAVGMVLTYDPQAVQFLNASAGPDLPHSQQEGKGPLFAVLAHTPGELVIGRGLNQFQAAEALLAQLDFRLTGSADEAVFALQELRLARSGQEVEQVLSLPSARLQPSTYLLGANFPNPFNPSTSIRFALAQTGPVTLVIYDLLGQPVRTLVDQPQHPLGFYTVEWDGRDQAGLLVGSGIYFYRLHTPAFEQTRKMILLK